MWNTMEERWKQAADRFSILVQVNQVDKSDQTDEATRDLLMAAPLLIEAGDVQTYDRLRRMELKRLAGTTNPIAAEHLVKTKRMLPADAALMKMLNPLGKIVQDSVESTDPKVNDGSFYAAWRTLALGLLEYRRGNFTAAAAWLDKCSQYPGQVCSCIARRHALASSVLFHLGKVQEGKVELTLAEEMIGEYFNHGKLGGGDNTSGHVQGWLQARVLLCEAETTEPKFENANAFTSNR